MNCGAQIDILICESIQLALKLKWWVVGLYKLRAM
eukprot:XP_001705751.1 Hypothetical protein GL50803_37345 [Giardia lamblia ATCC 50803]